MRANAQRRSAAADTGKASPSAGARYFLHGPSNAIPALFHPGRTLGCPAAAGFMNAVTLPRNADSLSLLDSISTPIALVDKSGHVLFANRTLRECEPLPLKP